MNLNSIARTSRASIDQNDTEVLLRILQFEKIEVVLEIGMFHGWSAKNWIDAFNPSLFIGIDQGRKPEEAHQIEREGIHYLWETSSHADTTLNVVKQLLGDRKIDFLFVDGDHTIEGVTKDAEMYGDLVKDGGVIAFHDILFLKQECNVKPLWDFMKEHYFYVEMVTGGASTGMGILFKNKKSGPLVDL